MKILIGDNCTACDRLKESLDAEGIKIELCHEDERSGRDFLMQYPVMGKPCLAYEGKLYFGDEIYAKIKEELGK